MTKTGFLGCSIISIAFVLLFVIQLATGHYLPGFIWLFDCLFISAGSFTAAHTYNQYKALLG